MKAELKEAAYKIHYIPSHITLECPYCEEELEFEDEIQWSNYRLRTGCGGYYVNCTACNKKIELRGASAENVTV
ncbi:MULTISPECIES: hypothetical protein [Listeria]|uniref:hypothetical protein n=1 Tax=Listeria TaxID=1637 RepID=UPI000B58A46D|nr:MULTISPECIES: hypothetical protein [Listeria]